MSEHDPLIEAMDKVIAIQPTTADQLVEILAALSKVASRWSDVLDALHEPTRNLVGLAAAASLEVARRRAEESFVELEITLGDAIAAHGRRNHPPQCQW